MAYCECVWPTYECVWPCCEWVWPICGRVWPTVSGCGLPVGGCGLPVSVRDLPTNVPSNALTDGLLVPRGTPRQDVPNHIYKDPAMYDDVFDKKGNFVKRTTPKFSSPLDTQEYNRCTSVHQWDMTSLHFVCMSILHDPTLFACPVYMTPLVCMSSLHDPLCLHVQST